MDRFTLGEFEALYARHEEHLRTEDYFHARSAAALCGKAPKDLMAFQPRPNVILGPDGKPAGPSFEDALRQFGVTPDPEPPHS